jgi:hypothetical protein
MFPGLASFGECRWRDSSLVYYIDKAPCSTLNRNFDEKPCLIDGCVAIILFIRGAASHRHTADRAGQSPVRKGING